MKKELFLLSLVFCLAAFAGNENAAVRSVSYHGQFLDALTGAPKSFIPMWVTFPVAMWPARSISPNAVSNEPSGLTGTP